MGSRSQLDRQSACCYCGDSIKTLKYLKEDAKEEEEGRRERKRKEGREQIDYQVLGRNDYQGFDVKECLPSTFRK